MTHLIKVIIPIKLQDKKLLQATKTHFFVSLIILSNFEQIFGIG